MTWGGYGGPPGPPSGDPFGPNPSGPDPFGGDPRYQPPFASPPPRPAETNTFATLSVVFAVLFAPLGALLGHLGLSQIRRTGQRGRDRAIIGITLSYKVITVVVVALVIWVAQPGDGDAAQPVASPSSSTGSPTSTPSAAPPPTTTTAATGTAVPPTTDAITAVVSDPTCGSMEEIDRELDVATRDLPIATMYSSAEWSPEQRDVMNRAAAATRTAADRLVPYIEQTPNRLVRQLYEQYIAYNRAFATSVPKYVPALGRYYYAAGMVAFAVSAICRVVQDGKPDVYAAQIAPVDVGQPPPAPPADPANAPLMLTAPLPNCSEWRPALPTSLSGDLTSDRAKGNDYAEVILGLGRQSGNALVYDFAGFAAYYLRVAAVVTDDNVQKGYVNTADTLWEFIITACDAVAP